MAAAGMSVVTGSKPKKAGKPGRLSRIEIELAANGGGTVRCFHEGPDPFTGASSKPYAFSAVPEMVDYVEGQLKGEQGASKDENAKADTPAEKTPATPKAGSQADASDEEDATDGGADEDTE